MTVKNFTVSRGRGTNPLWCCSLPLLHKTDGAMTGATESRSFDRVVVSTANGNIRRAGSVTFHVDRTAD
jgi:hypothetical protein